jgi:hypothetical protein
VSESGASSRRANLQLEDTVAHAPFEIRACEPGDFAPKIGQRPHGPHQRATPARVAGGQLDELPGPEARSLGGIVEVAHARVDA